MVESETWEGVAELAWGWLTVAPPEPVNVGADDGVVDFAGDAVDEVDVGEGVGDDLVGVLLAFSVCERKGVLVEKETRT